MFIRSYISHLRQRCQLQDPTPMLHFMIFPVVCAPELEELELELLDELELLEEPALELLDELELLEALLDELTPSP